MNLESCVPNKVKRVKTSVWGEYFPFCQIQSDVYKRLQIQHQHSQKSQRNIVTVLSSNHTTTPSTSEPFSPACFQAFMCPHFSNFISHMKQYALHVTAVQITFLRLF
jgi:hypothetical protein